MHLKSKLVVAVLLFLLPSALAENVTESQAEIALSQAKNTYNYLHGLNFPTERVSDLLTDAQYAFDSHQYGSAIDRTDEIVALKKAILEISTELHEGSVLYNQSVLLGLPSSNAKNYLDRAQVSFTTNNFEQASVEVSSAERMLNTQLEPVLSELRKELQALKSATEDVFTSAQFEQSIREFGLTDAEALLQLAHLEETFLILNKSVRGILFAQHALRVVSENVSLVPLQDLYDEAIVSFELGKFTRSIDLTNRFGSLLKELHRGVQLVNDAKKKLNAVSSFEAESALLRAQEFLAAGNYIEAQTSAREAMHLADQTRANTLLSGAVDKSEARFSLQLFLETYGVLFVIIVATLIVLGFIWYKQIYVFFASRWIHKLQREQESLFALIKKSQVSYYQERTIDKESYEISMDKYQERLLSVKEELSLLKQRLKAYSQEGAMLLNSLTKRGE